MIQNIHFEIEFLNRDFIKEKITYIEKQQTKIHGVYN